MNGIEFFLLDRVLNWKLSYSTPYDFIQIIFQDPYSSLNPHISVGNAIVEPMRVHGILNNDRERKKKVIEILEKGNLNEGHFRR